MLRETGTLRQSLHFRKHPGNAPCLCFYQINIIGLDEWLRGISRTLAPWLVEWGDGRVSCTIILAERKLRAAATKWKRLVLLLAISLAALIGGLSISLHHPEQVPYRAIPAVPMAHASIGHSSLALAVSYTTDSSDTGGGPPGL